VSRPTFTVIAGANGCGKSSLTRLNRELFRGVPLLDPDAVALTLKSASDTSSALAAGRQVLTKAAECLEFRRSFAIETTLSGKNYLQMMSDASGLGFEVMLIYIGTSTPDINIARVAHRVRNGGHDVPESDIRRRYKRSLINLPIALHRADYALLLDNSSERGYEALALFDHGTAEWLGDVPEWASFLLTRD
jgi:predicted ABC-type ATPase